MSCVRTFKVSNLLPLSIHCCISLTISVPFVNRHDTQTISGLTWPIKYKWKQSDVQTFQANSYSKPIIKLLEEYEMKKYEMNESGIKNVVNDINNVFYSIADKSNIVKVNIVKPKTGRMHNKPKSKAWYDMSCQSAYNNIKWLARQMSMKPLDNAIKHSYFRAKKE